MSAFSWDFDPRSWPTRARNNALRACFAIAPVMLVVASSCSAGDDTSGVIASDGGSFAKDASTQSDALASACVPGDVSSFTGGTYHPPAGAYQGKCDDDLLEAYIDCKKNTNPVSCNLLASGDGAACLSCLETKQTDANWGPIVYDASGTNGVPNLPGCLALAFGEGQSTTGCGATQQQEFNCQDLACNANCAASADASTSNLADLETCENAALLGGCKSFADAAQLACSGDAGGVDSMCYPATLEDGGAAEDVWSYIARLDGYFCGDPTADAGAVGDAE